MLIVGRTSIGKSTLSNVLFGTDNIRKNRYTINETNNLPEKDFEWNGTKYHVIEIIVESIEKRVLYNKIIELMPEGISQILFVVDESFTTKEKIMFGLFKKVIFKTGILKYVTVVFDNFKNNTDCEKDQKDALENEIIAEICKSCNGIIRVDNSLIDVDKEDDDDYERKIIVDRSTRKESRDKLLDYLEKKCQENYYKLDDLYSKITSYAKSDINFVEVEKAIITSKLI